MKNDYLNKIICSILTAILLLPLAVQVSHALENHEHVVCTAKDVKHFHAEELDCCLCCTPVELNTLQPKLSDYSLKLTEYFDNCETITQLTSLDFFPLKSPRAPPVLS